MENLIKVAVIGCGVLGNRHTEIYQKMPGVEVIGVSDLDLERAKTLANRHGIESSNSPQSFFGRVDAISICTPAITHYDVAKPVLQAGIHVLVEKPITTKLEAADELLKLAKHKRLILQTGHVERFNAAVRKMKMIVKDPIFIECDRIGPYDPRISDVGVVLDLMIHDIDILLYVVNSPILSIDTIGHQMLSHTEDFANVRIHFENGTVASLTASRMARDRLRKIRVFQQNAYISLDYSRQEALILTKENGKTEYQTIDIKKTDALRDELTEFIDCVRSKGEPSVSGEEGRAALEVALKIQKKIEEAQRARAIA